MTLLEWFGTGIGSACYLWAWRYFAGEIAWSAKGSRNVPDGSDIIWGVCVGAIAAALCPALLLGQWLRHRGIQSLVLYRVLHVPKEHK